MKKEKKHPQKRIHWVDILKFLGIFIIYFGHFFNDQTTIYHFIYLYNVPLFFFVSGFFTQSTEKPILSYYKDKIIKLMVPYLTFSFVALAYYSFFNRWGLSQIFEVAKTFVFGIRGQVYALSLWFIPCLFIITVFHYTIQKAVKNNYIPLAISLLLFVVTQTILPHNPLFVQKWIMNLDSAMYYYVFYALGGVLFPQINKIYVSLSKPQQIIRIAMSIMAIILTIIFYTFSDGWVTSAVMNLLPFLNKYNLIIHLFLLLPIGLTIIYAHIVFAKIISKMSILEKMGQETLIFCGTENIVKDFIFRVFGWWVNLSNPIIAAPLSFICLLISFYTIVQFSNKNFSVLIGKKK